MQVGLYERQHVREDIPYTGILGSNLYSPPLYKLFVVACLKTCYPVFLKEITSSFSNEGSSLNQYVSNN